MQAFSTDLFGRDALAVLAIATTPAAGKALSEQQVQQALRAAGRQRNLASTASKICAALRTEQLTAAPLVTLAYGATVTAAVAVLTELTRQVELLGEQVEASFGQHPDAEIYQSLPGLGPILGARVLTEFGDDPDRYVDAKAPKNYSGMSPITRASGTRKSSSPATPATSAWPTRSTSKRFLPSPAHPAPAPTTTPTANAEPPTTKPYEPSATASSGSCTAACATAPPTTKPPPGPTRSTRRNPPRLDNLQPWDV